MEPTVTERKSYISVEYTPILQIDKLHLQSYIAHGEGEPDLRTWLSLCETIRFHTGESTAHERSFYARLDSTSTKKRQAWLTEQQGICAIIKAAFEAGKEHNLEMIRVLQQEQRKFIDSLRAWNAKCLLEQKKAATERRDKERRALESGDFWECSEDTLKRFFNVPFSARKLVDVSEKHRAAFFVALEYGGYGTGLITTHIGYLCGIDNNGEQWGFRVRGNWSYDSTVVDAMSDVWGVPTKIVNESHRQGEILFHPEPVPPEVELVREGDWQIRPQHIVKSAGLEHDGDYFRSASAITVEHPTHHSVNLIPGEYRVYVHRYDTD